MPGFADVAANCLAYPYGWGSDDLNELFKLGCYEYAEPSQPTTEEDD